MMRLSSRPIAREVEDALRALRGFPRDILIGSWLLAMIGAAVAVVHDPQHLVASVVLVGGGLVLVLLWLRPPGVGIGGIGLHAQGRAYRYILQDEHRAAEQLELALCAMQQGIGTEHDRQAVHEHLELARQLIDEARSLDPESPGTERTRRSRRQRQRAS